MKKIKIRKYPDLSWYFLNVDTENTRILYMFTSAIYGNIRSVETQILKISKQL